MLIQFRFENFRSFRDDTILDFTATKITENSFQVRKAGGESLLPVAALYGANAGGKSNVVDALDFMAEYVLDSFAYGDSLKDDGDRRLTARRAEPFAFEASSKEKPSSFEVYFTISEEDGWRSYNYGFTVGKAGVEEEWLNCKARTAREFSPVFSRVGQAVEWGRGKAFARVVDAVRENLSASLEPEVLVVSLGAKLKDPFLKKMRDWFLGVRVVDFGSPFEDCLWSHRVPVGFDSDERVREDVVRYFSAFDPSIVGFRVEETNIEEERRGRRLRIFSRHENPGTGERVEIPFECESDGTLKMFALYPMLQLVLRRGGILVADELNAKLHPHLVRGILLAFLNPETNGHNAQLVFTCHDPWQLSHSSLRRDEIWFTQKDKSGATELYSLADFSDDGDRKIRKDENYEKNHMLGKYGAVPEIFSFDLPGGN